MQTLGLQFIDTDPKFIEIVHQYLARLVVFYKQQNPQFKVAPNELRSTYRLPIDIDLPTDNFLLETWIGS